MAGKQEIQRTQLCDALQRAGDELAEPADLIRECYRLAQLLNDGHPVSDDSEIREAEQTAAQVVYF